MYRLIVVDDEKIIRDGLCTYFQNDDSVFDVVGSFDTASKAIEYLKNNRCDVVLTDIRMEGISGLDLAKFVFEEKMNTKVVLISGYGEFEYAQRALQFKVFNYLLKPVRFRQLDELCEDLKKSLDEELKKSTEDKDNIEKNSTTKEEIDKDSMIDLKEVTDDEDVMKLALSYIDSNFTKDLTLSDVASFVYFSPVYFGRIFKNYTNESFTDYIIGKRIEKAKELLEKGLKVRDVSLSVGYENTKYFMRIFKKKVGKTPGEYQRKKRGNL